MARKRIKKFSALVGMIGVTTLLVLFFLAVPAFWASSAGKVFAVVWLLVAACVLVAFGDKVFARKTTRPLATVYRLRSRDHVPVRAVKLVRRTDIPGPAAPGDKQRDRQREV